MFYRTLSGCIQSCSSNVNSWALSGEAHDAVIVGLDAFSA